jgi:SAM-dependent methyltransferase
VDIEDVYDAIAEPYAEKLADELDRKPFDRDLLDSLVSRFGAGLVADIGCGPGHVGRYLYDRGVDIVGIDLSAEMLRVAGERNPGMRFEKADVRSLPFADGELAGAVAFYSLIHLDDPEVPVALGELRRVIENGGVLCLAVHGGEGRVAGDEWFGRAVHFEATLWSIAPLGVLLTDAGFTIESAVARPPYPEEGQNERIYITAGCSPPASR